MHETERFDVAERVAISKARLSEKLSELARRVDHARESVRPEHLAKKPWVIAAAGIAGFLVGLRLRRPRAEMVRGRDPSIVRSVVREILIVAAGHATRRYLGTGHAPEPRA
jgi:hypothetical protein